MSPKPQSIEPHKLTATRLAEIDRATPDWETLEREVDFGPRAHVRVLLEHIAYLEQERTRYLRLARRGGIQSDEENA